VAFADLAFPTPSGRIELRSEEAARRWGVDPLPAYVPPPGGGPLVLLTPNHKNAIHSQFVTLPVIAALDAGHRIVLSPKDAADRGLEAGDRARVFNARGSLVLPLALEPGLLEGVAVAFNGYGARHGGSVNLLSEGVETDMGFGAAFHDTRVDVEKAP
jgi:anaerobic selenocysteine-containing dehydrogenase